MSRAFSTVRARFALLLLIAAVPLFATGAAIAYQNARLLVDRDADAVVIARDAILLRQSSFVLEGERLLTALVLSPVILEGGPACDAALDRVLAVGGGRYLSLVVLDPDGQRRCSAGVAVQEAMLALSQMATVDPSHSPGTFKLGDVTALASGQIGLPIALPLLARSGTGPAGGAILLATINEERLLAPGQGSLPTSGLRAWILRTASPTLALGEAAHEAFPTVEDLTRLETTSQRVTHGDGAGGRPYIFALADLFPGTRLLLAETTAASRSAAELVLGRRLAELGLVLLAGLAVVALGADLTVGRPLKRVAQAVARWRAGGPFQAGSLAWAPTEIAELAQSFSAATAALGVRERQLRDATAQQELLMQEIHHRVKNNLQVVASLLNLQASRIRHTETKAEFHAARDRIRALATLHRHLYAHGELHTINMRGFLEELCDQLLHAMGETPDGGRIALTIEASELQISSDQAVPMALLVTEAVSNAVKYAFPGGRSGHIAVRLAVRSDAAGQQTARLTIDDDGVGIPAGRAETASGIRDGLGLHLIRGFARQLGSELEMVEEHGTHYAVDIVLRRDRTDEWPDLGGEPDRPA